jgi:hypothetical protein
MKIKLMCISVLTVLQANQTDKAQNVQFTTVHDNDNKDGFKNSKQIKLNDDVNLQIIDPELFDRYEVGKVYFFEMAVPVIEPPKDIMRENA